MAHTYFIEYYYYASSKRESLATTKTKSYFKTLTMSNLLNIQEYRNGDNIRRVIKVKMKQMVESERKKVMSKLSELYDTTSIIPIGEDALDKWLLDSEYKIIT
jgi:hypothetical protein